MVDTKVDAHVENECRNLIRSGLKCLINLLLIQSIPGAFLMSRLVTIYSISLMLMNSS